MLTDAQNCKRLYLHVLVDFEELSTVFQRDDQDKNDEDVNFLRDLVRTNGPLLYWASAMAWKGVRSKTRLLKDDLKVSNLSYESNSQWSTVAIGMMMKV